jgi:hypothetical protein
MLHNSGGVTNIREKIVPKSKESPTDDDEGDVGGLNRTSHLVKSLILVSMSLESCVTSAMNPKP